MSLTTVNHPRVVFIAKFEVNLIGNKPDKLCDVNFTRQLKS